jgi:hypothetical protein
MNLPPIQLLFVYNAKGGFWNGALDSAHKVVSPDTYDCKLCAVTFGLFGMKKEWAQFLEELKKQGVSVEFAHKGDQLPLETKLPAVIMIKEKRPSVLISAEEFVKINDLNAMKTLMREKLASI